ncbi:MAG: kynureninase [Sphingobacteriia bacterium]|nr:MAG: kynureninase [Sphingobacteriia bacterium]
MTFSADSLLPAWALAQDQQDPLRSLAAAFHFPQHQQKPVIYLCGNSLGLQPKALAAAMETELKTWQEEAVGGYFKGPNPWLYYQEYLRPGLAKWAGALPEEVSAMNALTVNLHLLMLGFYRPQGTRKKIIMEAGAFPSDQYAMETLVKHFGLDPDSTIIEIAPKAGEQCLHTADIVDTILATGEELAMVLFAGIQYYTGQFFDIPRITQAAHQVGAVAGFDLAHAMGNVELALHDWQVDFAAWCSYKYLNAGPGAVGGYFVHQKHASNPSFPRLAGWWGNDEKERFKMEKGFQAKADAGGWNISTAQIFNMVGLKTSLELLAGVSPVALRQKSQALTAYLAFVLSQLPQLKATCITPSDPAQRGAQLSYFFAENGKAIQQKMLENGIVTDYREPGVIRFAPAPLYCGFQDIQALYALLKENF